VGPSSFPQPFAHGPLWDLWVPYYTRYNPQELRLYNIIYDSKPKKDIWDIL
jgi:hypothetical protein